MHTLIIWQEFSTRFDSLFLAGRRCDLVVRCDPQCAFIARRALLHSPLAHRCRRGSDPTTRKRVPGFRTRSGAVPNIGFDC